MGMLMRKWGVGGSEVEEEEEEVGEEEEMEEGEGEEEGGDEDGRPGQMKTRMLALRGRRRRKMTTPQERKS